MRDLFGNVVAGTGLGFVLSRAGYSSWDEIHRMFTLADLRLSLTFVCAVVLLAVAWRVIAKLSASPPYWPSRSPHRGTLIGGALFGAGWALSGACPSIALVQLGEGQLLAFVTLTGIVLGNWCYSLVHERLLRWDIGSCADE